MMGGRGEGGGRSAVGETRFVVSLVQDFFLFTTNDNYVVVR